mmetsp:Transcript_9914/g.27847  ORF Transcript_9914/g.27847 Transcript_9914/m.27847 type:complete len:362 (+) Transcript_9914:420-1505(+)
MRAEFVQHLVQAVPEVHGCGDVPDAVEVLGHAVFVRREDLAVVPVHDPCMQLHDEPVLCAHLGHLHQHVGLEVSLLLDRDLPPTHRGRKVALHLLQAPPFGLGQHGLVVAADRPERLEVLPPHAERLQELREGADPHAGEVGQGVDLLAPARGPQVEQIPGVEGGADLQPELLLGLGELPQVARGAHLGADHLNVEVFHQHARAHLPGPQPVVDQLVDLHGVVAVQHFVDVEHVPEGLPQPQRAGRAAQPVEVVGERLPDLPRIRLHPRDVGGAALGRAGRVPLPHRNPQPLEPDPLRVQDAQNVHVVVDEEVHRVPKGGGAALPFVDQRERRRLGMRRHEGELLDGVEQPVGHALVLRVL